jgi:hypothetical protein
MIVIIFLIFASTILVEEQKNPPRAVDAINLERACTSLLRGSVASVDVAYFLDGQLCALLLDAATLRAIRRNESSPKTLIIALRRGIARSRRLAATSPISRPRACSDALAVHRRFQATLVPPRNAKLTISSIRKSLPCRELRNRLDIARFAIFYIAVTRIRRPILVGRAQLNRSSSVLPNARPNRDARLAFAECSHPKTFNVVDGLSA